MSPLPFSWLRISSQTSHKLRQRIGDNQTKVHFQKCLTEIVEADGGSIDKILFEQNGKYAHVHIAWDTHDQKQNIVFDTQAVTVVDLLTAEEIDDLQTRRNEAD